MLIFTLSLCGCKSSYYEPEQIIIVSSIGIDATESGLLLTLETVDTSKPDGNWEYSPKTMEITEKDCETAYKRLQQSLGNKLNCEHCVLMVFGKNTKSKEIFISLKFLSESENLSQNTKVVKSENANKLIKTKSYSGQAVGYDIVKILNLQGRRETNLQSNLYWILKDKGNKELQLVEISMENNKYFLKEKKR